MKITLFWALNLRGMCKYLTFKPTFTNKSRGLCVCRTLTDNKSHTVSTQKQAQAQLPWSRAGWCLQAVYLSLRGTESKLINCSWLHAELARVWAPWSCHRYGGKVPRWEHQAALGGSQPVGGTARAEEKVTNPTPEHHLGMSARCFGSSAPLDSPARRPPRKGRVDSVCTLTCVRGCYPSDISLYFSHITSLESTRSALHGMHNLSLKCY